MKRIFKVLGILCIVFGLSIPIFAQLMVFGYTQDTAFATNNLSKLEEAGFCFGAAILCTIWQAGVVYGINCLF